MKTANFIENGKEIKVEIEKWCWGVIYNDDTELHQFDDKNNFHQFKEIKNEEVKMFVMYKNDDRKNRIDMPIHDGDKFFHFYTNVKAFYSDHFVKVYVFGIQHKGVSTYHYILPDDRMIISTYRNIDLVQFNV